MNTRLSSTKVTTDHMAVFCRRVSGRPTVITYRETSNPAAATETTPEAPTNSAGSHAAYGVSSDTVFSTTDTDLVRRWIQSTTPPTASPITTPPAAATPNCS